MLIIYSKFLYRISLYMIRISQEVHFKSQFPPWKCQRVLYFSITRTSHSLPQTLLVHSAKLDQYIAIRSQISEAFATAVNTSEKREWYSLDSIAALKPDITLIYADHNPKEIFIVAGCK